MSQKKKKPKQREPFYRQDRGLWYVQLDGRQINLGPDRDAAWQRYHELMAARAKEQPLVPAAAKTVIAALERFIDNAQSVSPALPDPDSVKGAFLRKVARHS
jgi:hypothetical protein